MSNETPPARSARRVLVIADDLTGSAEIAGIALRHGLPTRIARDDAAAHEGTLGAEGVLVIDSDSRLATPAGAMQRIRSLLDGVRADAFDLIYKKTDSVMRGPVLAELEATVDLLKMESALFLPQNPARGRTIESGRYVVDGTPLDQTEFAHDPDYPAWTSNVLKLLGTSSAFRTTHLSAADAPTVEPRSIVMADGGATEDLDAWAGRVPRQTLCAGAAEFFEALLRNRGRRTVEITDPKPPAGASTLIISGSASPTAHQFAVEAGKRKWKVCRMPEMVFGGEGATDRGLKQWADATLAALKADGRAIIAIDHAVDRTPGTGRRLERAIARVTAEVVKRQPVEQLLVDGGATASACANAIGWTHFETLAELLPGVVRLRPITKATTELNCSMVVKPGSYRWPDALLK